MNPGIQQAILTVGNSLALSTLAKATFAVTLGLCAAGVAGQQRAAIRHALLAGTFGVLLALPLVSVVAPPVRIAMRVAQARGLRTPAARTGTGISPIVMAPPGAAAEPQSWPVYDLLMLCWIAGTALFLAPVAVGLRQVRRLRRSGLPWQHGQSVVDALALDSRIGRRVDVLLHEALPGPMTCGSLRAAIVFPVDAPNWDADDLNRAAVHELEHVSRGDWAIHCAARVACAIYWFHPLVWIAWRQLELEAERACDDAVLARSEATAYADQLVAVARRLSAASNAPLLAMASRADLASRVNAVLDGGQRRGRAGRLCVAVATAAAAALVLTVSPLRMVAAPQAAGAVPEFRTETRLVVTAVTVSYPNGSAIHGLTASDFVVREDGVPQTVSFFDVRNGGGAEPPSDYYVLGYYPINTRADGQVRKIDISVKTATTAKVETRAGYYAMRRPDNPPSGAAKSLATGTTPPPPPNSRPPVLLFKKEPEYSEAARNAKYQGTVVLNVEVDDSGKVQDCRVTRSLGLGLDEKAIEAVQQWRFRPATKDGKPIAARTVVEVSFRLM